MLCEPFHVNASIILSVFSIPYLVDASNCKKVPSFFNDIYGIEGSCFKAGTMKTIIPQTKPMIQSSRRIPAMPRSKTPAAGSLKLKVCIRARASFPGSVSFLSLYPIRNSSGTSLSLAMSVTFLLISNPEAHVTLQDWQLMQGTFERSM